MANQTIDIKNASRRNWSTSTVNEHGYPGDENIKIGCMQRIADATEAMAKNHVQLQSDYDYMKGSRDHYRNLYETEKRRSAALRGVINKMKKKL